MEEQIGDLLADERKRLSLTQDQFGKKYGISGPAVFKFEKNYVRPSLQLWLSMAKDLKISEEDAVLMWIRSKLPKKLQEYVVRSTVAARERGGTYKVKPPKPKKPADPEKALKAVLSDRSAPKGLKQLLRDSDFCALYKPNAEELDVLQNVFGQLGGGSKSAYREALRLVREFPYLQ